jgi:hypothetical protein
VVTSVQYCYVCIYCYFSQTVTSRISPLHKPSCQSVSFFNNKTKSEELLAPNVLSAVRRNWVLDTQQLGGGGDRAETVQPTAPELGKIWLQNLQPVTHGRGICALWWTTQCARAHTHTHTRFWRQSVRTSPAAVCHYYSSIYGPAQRNSDVLLSKRTTFGRPFVQCCLFFCVSKRSISVDPWPSGMCPVILHITVWTCLLLRERLDCHKVV